MGIVGAHPRIGLRECVPPSGRRRGRYPTGCGRIRPTWCPATPGRSLPETFRLNRDRLELELESLRARKGELSLELYLERLEVLMLELARLYESYGQLATPSP